LLLLLLFL